MEERPNSATEKPIPANTAITPEHSSDNALMFNAIVRRRSLAALLSPQGLVLASNRDFRHVSGMPEAEMRGKRLQEARCWTQRAQRRIAQAIGRAAAGQFVRCKVTLQQTRNREATIDCFLNPVRLHSSNLPEVGGEERRLSARLLAVQEEERRRLSTDLHDKTSPTLAAIKVNIETIYSELTSGTAEDLQLRLEDTIALLDETNATIRDIGADLRPAPIDEGGFPSALTEYAARFASRTGIEVQLSSIDMTVRFEPEAETQLFRIVQEALANCAKHSKARAVTLELKRKQDCAVPGARAPAILCISDDGLGFDPAMIGQTGRAPGLGLVTMRERAEIVGGHIAIDSQLGKGTRVTVEIGS